MSLCVYTHVRSVRADVDVRWFLLCLHLVCLALGCRDALSLMTFYTGTGNWNPGPHVWATGTLQIEASPSPILLLQNFRASLSLLSSLVFSETYTDSF